jgi:glutamyl-tRNA synthetase
MEDDATTATVCPMSSSAYRGRFAPSPTGALHLGLARTALLGFLHARSQGGAFVLRIEDIDTPRVVQGAVDALRRDLAWLGITWDEGPDQGGPFAPYVQSERSALYESALDALRDEGLAYPCSCSRKEISLASAPHGAGELGPVYPGTCRAGPARPDQPLSLRMRVEGPLPSFYDGLLGEVAPEAQGDFVLRRADGLFSYQLAVVVDDIAMKMSHVLRGDDLKSSTAWQIALYRALGSPPPVFIHVPLVVAADGTRLAKRHGAASIASLRERGVAAESVVGLLAESAGLVAKGTKLRADELIADFSLTRVPRERVVVEVDALR